jgi:hypothetical protein
MLRTDPKKQWERFGQVDPYYGVVSQAEMRGDHGPEARKRFFNPLSCVAGPWRTQAEGVAAPAPTP